MADEGKKGKEQNRVSREERMKFIGFEVFPGKTKDLFESDKEKSDFVAKVQERREAGTQLREDCKLVVERVSFSERLILGIASLIVLVSLFLPWFSVYSVVEEEAPAVTVTEEIDLVADSALAQMTDSLSGDSTALAGMTTDSAMVTAATGADNAQGKASQQAGTAQGAGDDANEEIITGHQSRRKIRKEYSSLSALGTFASIGSISSHIFGGGVALTLAGVVMLLLILVCIALPVFNLWAIFGLKGSTDEVALKLKKYLQYNWIPVLLYFLAIVISIGGAEYSPDTLGLFDSLGNSYGLSVFFGTLSWGAFVSLAAFILVALKGVEI